MVMKQYDIAIIGNSAAGLAAAKKIRQLSPDASLVMIDREDTPAYSRVLTPYYIGGKAAKEKIYIVDTQFYKDLNIDTVFGQSVMGLDAADQQLELADGSRIGFNFCLIATGAEATKIAVSSQRASVLRHMDDAEKMISLLEGASSITGIGAGLVSIPILSHAVEGIEKNLIIGSGRVFSRVVNPEAAEILEKIFVAKGVTIYKHDDIVRSRDTDKLELTLKSGTTLRTDALFVGKGVTPNISIAAEAGLEVNDGIVIDARCQTSVERIFAAGDCAEGIDFITGKKTIQGNWMTAVEQGEVAACNMLGKETLYDGSLKNNITEVFGVEVAVIGYYWDDAPAGDTFYDPASGIYRKVFLDESGRVIGAVLIGDTNCSGLFTNLVKTRAKYPGSSWLNKSVSYAAMMEHLR